MAGRKFVTGMYRNVDFSDGKRSSGHAIQFERSYRLATAEFYRGQKPRRGAYKRVTEWFEMMHPKARKVS